MWPFKKEKIDTRNIVREINAKYRLRRYLELIIGCFLVAIAFNLFLLPNNIVSGGVSGLAVIAKDLLNINPSYFIMISSLILLVVSYFTLGKEKTAGTVLGSIIYPLCVNLTENISDYIQVGDELLLAAIFGGILYGFGAGLVFRAGFTTGGTDVINQIIAQYGKVSMGNAMLMSDGLIVLSGVFIFGVNKLMYAIIVIYLVGLLTDRVLLGISDSKAFYIIAEEEERIREYVLKELGHGVTIFDTKGGFMKEKQKLLFCVIPTKEYYRLKMGIHEIDPKAFFVATDAYEVSGGE